MRAFDAHVRISHQPDAAAPCRRDDLGRDLLVEFDVTLEFRNDGARQRLCFDFVERFIADKTKAELGAEALLFGSRCAASIWKTLKMSIFRGCGTRRCRPILQSASGGYGWTRTTDLSIMSAAL